MFSQNEIIRFQEADGGEVTERILWIDDGYVICYTIDITSKNANPVKRRMSDLEELLNQQLLHMVNEDPFSFIYQSEEQISEKEKEIRDKRWRIIEEIVLLEPDIYQKRGHLVQKLVESGRVKSEVYKYLRQYWQQGKVKNALLPKYRNSGGRGKERKLGEKKTGRPRKFKAALGEGINVTVEIKRIFQVAIKRYYHTTKKNSLKTTYDMMLDAFFAEDYIYENGVKKSILKDKNSLPTFRQFQTWYKKTYDIEEKNRKRKGNRKFELEDRAVLGSSVGPMYGPGTKFQIDATVADVYLVSSYNRNWIIGRPVVYAVIDVFSRMVVGIYVGLEGPSWMGAMMALANAASDKVSYCGKYGIEVTKDQWSANHLPETLLADRGELEGYNVERLITAFNIKVENTPPYRGDLKGIVEQHFRTINLRVKPFLPGIVDTDVRVRGDRDYRLDAKLTLDEFIQVIIRGVLYHNNDQWLKKYKADETMIAEELNLIPRELWNWGIKNRSGRLRTYSENIVKLHLLPQASARVTFKGIEFKGMKYSCEKAVRERWFSQARKKSWRIRVAYDPRNTSYLYLPSEDGNSYEVCNLLEHETRYNKRSLDDVIYLHAFEEFQKQSYAHEEMQRKISHNSDIKAVVDNAEKGYESEKVPMSNNQRVKGIRDNREFEKEERRKEEAFLLANYEERTEGAEVVPISNEEDTVKPKSKTELLRRKQMEMKNRAKSRTSL